MFHHTRMSNSDEPCLTMDAIGGGDLDAVLNAGNESKSSDADANTT